MQGRETLGIQPRTGMHTGYQSGIRHPGKPYRATPRLAGILWPNATSFLQNRLSATYSTIHMTLPLRTRTATPTRPTVLLHDLPEQSIHRTHRSVATCMAGRRILGYSEATIARRVMRVVRHGVGSPINVCHHLLAGLSRPINLYPLRGASDVSLLVISGRLGEVLEPVMWQGRYLIEIRDAVDKL